MSAIPVELLRIPSAKMETEFERILIKHGFSNEKAKTCAEIITRNSVDGVYSHGVNRFPNFIECIKEGSIQPRQYAVCKSSTGNLEQWEGQSGPGPVNAVICTERVIEIATQYGMGCIALANTNHWLRGGTYGWLAAKKGFVFIGWSNTIANMPAWGATNPTLGNNPLVIAIPYKDEAIVLDMAMSQYSYGALELHHLKNQKLMVPGGYNSDGEITTDPHAIINSRRPLPIGFWKGAGLSLLLDMLATMLSGGLSTSEISKQKSERNLSQVFLAVDIKRLSNYKSIAFTLDQIIEDYRDSTLVDPSKNIRYPGEQVLKIRDENLRNGIPVLKKVWNEIELL